MDRKVFVFLWDALDGRLMVQEAKMPHTELHGMEEAKAGKSARIGWKE